MARINPATRVARDPQTGSCSFPSRVGWSRPGNSDSPVRQEGGFKIGYHTLVVVIDESRPVRDGRTGGEEGQEGGEGGRDEPEGAEGPAAMRRGRRHRAGEGLPPGRVRRPFRLRRLRGGGGGGGADGRNGLAHDACPAGRGDGGGARPAGAAPSFPGRGPRPGRRLRNGRRAPPAQRPSAAFRHRRRPLLRRRAIALHRPSSATPPSEPHKGAVNIA